MELGERIKTKMIEHGLPAPKFELNGNFLKVILWAWRKYS